MRSLQHKKSKILLVLAALAVCVSVGGAGPAAAAPVTINLCATTGSATMPGSVAVPIWGFVRLTGVQTCADVTGTAQLAAPVLEVNMSSTDDVTINVSSDLPAGHTPSFELPGFQVTQSGSSYAFKPDRTGTFVYQSSGDAGRQMAMGLAGALVVRASGADADNVRDTPCVGDSANQDCVLVLNALDPAFNQAFNANPDDATIDMKDYLATYWLINGVAYTDGSPPSIAAPASQNLLLRYANAGYDNTSMMLLGLHESVLARGGYALTNPLSANTETIPAGGTEEALVTIPSSPAPPSANGYPLFNRNLHVTNGSRAAGTYESPGGMLIFLDPSP